MKALRLHAEGVHDCGEATLVSANPLYLWRAQASALQEPGGALP